MAAKDMPFIKFFPRDWMSDEKLRLCSLAARGLWLELLCLMHQNTRRRGYLEHSSGVAVSSDQVARAVGISGTEASALLRELGDAGVFSRDENGVIYSRRMVGEERFRESCSAAGKASAKNPRMRGAGGKLRGSATERPPNDPPNASRTTDRTHTEPSEIRDQRSDKEEEKTPQPRSGAFPSGEPCGYCGATEQQTGHAHELDHFIPRCEGGVDGAENRILN